MIFKSSAHTGDRLAAHLLNAEENERVRSLDARNLIDSDLVAAINQFAAETAGTRAKAGMVHVSASPDPRYQLTQSDWDLVWSEYEREFGLRDQARTGVEHLKHGRGHQHQVYARIDDTGRAIPLSHNYPRQELVARVCEYRLGHQPTRGKHQAYVMRRLQAERPEIAAWIERELGDGPTPEAVAQHNEWQQEQRTGISHERVAELAAGAWRSADTGPAFEAALAENELALAAGEKTIQLVDPAGGTHDLRRSLRAGGERVRARDVRERIDSAALPSVEAIRAAQHERGAEQSASMLTAPEQTEQHQTSPESTHERHTDPPRGAQRDGATELGETKLGDRRLRELRELDLARANPDPERAADRPDTDSDVLPRDARADRPDPAPVQRVVTDRDPERLIAALHQERERLDELERQLPQLREQVRSRHPDRRLSANSAWAEAQEWTDIAHSALVAAQDQRRRDRERAERWGVLSPAWWRRGRHERDVSAASAHLVEAKAEQQAVREAVWRRCRPAYDQACYEYRTASQELGARRERLHELNLEAEQRGIDTRREQAPQRQRVRERVRERGIEYEPQGP